MWVQLSDGLGSFDFSFEIVGSGVASKGEEIPPVLLTLPNQGIVYNFHRRLLNVPFARPGLYDFHLVALVVRDIKGTAVTGQPPQLLATAPLLLV